jgi:uncharacterized peroxidase-related enzyme
MDFPRTTALDLAPPDPLPDEVAELFAKCQEKLGLVPNVLAAYAHDPDRLRAFSQMYNSLMLSRGGLTMLEREMIAVAVSAINRCWYCLVAHGAAVRVMSRSPELGEALALDHRFAGLSPRERALVDFARKLTLASADIGEADRAALRAHGLTDKDIWDAAEVAAFFNMSNRLASAVGMVPNPEYHAQGRPGDRGA